MRFKKSTPVGKVKIYGVKISQDDSGCFTFSVQHTGQFNLSDYETLDFEVNSTRLVRRS